MRKTFTTFFIALASLCAATSTQAQSTAMDFNCIDCNGNWQHLYADLDAGNVVILEYFMTNCSPCVTAGNYLEQMKADLLAEFPGKIKAYSIGFTNSYSCTSINNWVNNNGFTSIPVDSGGAQVAYYGGMGMPTIVIAAGSNHDILGVPYIGFTPSDTAVMAYDIRAFLGTPTAVSSIMRDSYVRFFPNPANDYIHLDLYTHLEGDLDVDVMDVMGKQVASLLHEKIQGEYEKTLNVSQLAPGTYFLRVNLGGSMSSHKITVVH
jgi:hypothetical protein